jgi:solute carrier family 50 protein (sugar transporter)
MLAVNCLSWFIYGLLVKNYYITIPNLIGLEFSLYYLLLVYHLHTASQRNRLRLIVMGGCALVGLSASVAFGSLSPSSAQNTLGVTSVIALIVFYSSPLSNFVHVIKEKDARSIQPGLAIATAVNSILWGAYGFALADLVCHFPFNCKIKRLNSNVTQTYRDS